MARQIIVEQNGNRSTFDISKVDRKKLYGTRKRINLDPKEQPCTRASLTEDGSLLVRSGMIAMGYFDSQKKWIPNSELVGLDPEGNTVDLVPSTLGKPEKFEGPVSPQDVFDLQVNVVYALEPQEIEEKLKKALISGKVFRFCFNYRADYRAELAYLVANKTGFYALVGQPAPPEWCSLETQAHIHDDEEMEDDLDFEMF